MMAAVAVIGGGRVAKALGTRLLETGVTPRFGVRPPFQDRELPGEAMSIAEAAGPTEVLILTVPAGVAVSCLASVPDLGEKIVVDCTNPLRWDEGPVWHPPTEGSVANALSRAFPEAHVVKAFNHFGAEIHAHPVGERGPVDALVAADDVRAKDAVIELAGAMGFRARDFGGLRNAAVMENLAVAWIHLSSVGGLGRHLEMRFDTR